jgi:hypothetical protein
MEELFINKVRQKNVTVHIRLIMRTYVVNHFLEPSYSVYAASRHSLAKFDIMANVSRRLSASCITISAFILFVLRFDSRPVTWASSDLSADLAKTIGIFIHFVF